MRRIRFRAPLTVLATALFLAFSFQSTPSDPAVSDPLEIPFTSDAAEIQDLARWMVDGHSDGGRLQAFRPGDLEAVSEPASRRRDLSLFDAGSVDDARRRFLYGIPYGSTITLAAERNHVDGLLVAAVVSVESRFRPGAVSPKGAQGLMQVLPLVAAAYDARDLFDPYVNVDVGSRYLGSLLKDYDGDLELALAAYNAGPAAVARYGGVPPFRETREYVRKVLACYEEYSRSTKGNPGPAGI
jgi:hypothetical protein